MEIDCKNKIILVFSDPHQEIDKVEYILNKENYDVAVCLGDWFDSFIHNSECDLKKTCNFLKKWIFKDNFYTCIGNHDISYLYDNNTTICSGYSPDKDRFIVDYFGNFLPVIRNKFKWYIWLSDFLCSHAGINTYHMNPMVELTKDGVTKWLDEQIEYATPALIHNGFHWLYGAGAARGGRQNIGGITWQDFDCEFEPIDGIKQIVGHTPHPTILNHKLDGNLDFTICDNLDIDCHLSQYLLINNGKITIKNTKDL
jgi:Calcineurin-like phosphoesterase